MAKGAFTVAAIAALAIAGGCRTGGVGVGDGPVAPEINSSERSQSGDPTLPFLKPWWRD